jgi:zeta-carotene desaturase
MICSFFSRQVLHEAGPDGKTRVKGLRVGPQGREQLVTADAYVAALDVPGIKKLLPQEWRGQHAMFENIYKLSGVPVITVQLRYNGWVTEIQDPEKVGVLFCYRESSYKYSKTHVWNSVLQAEQKILAAHIISTPLIQAKDLSRARGLDNLLYSSDVFFSCFADLALVSPVEYYKSGEGSLMQV